ncbi:hypothetical protein [Nocardioides humi]|uniref:Uncharacterized protein n=1 Tax=Nocardioides humi TaxID=449461 RepID=A0ABN2AVK8_9ACTN|nr:hypothetical protein [Nocardioides humi]
MTTQLRTFVVLCLLAPWAALLLAPPASGTTETTPDGAELEVPDEVVFGTSLRLEGRGWTHPAGGGSGVVVKFDVRGPDDTPVTTQRDITDPVNGGVYADKSIHGAVVADDNGSWSLTIPLPTLENSDALWFPGEVHHVRVLSGSAKDGDTGRSVGVDFTVTAPTSTCTAESVSLQVASTAGFGQPLRVQGTGWCHPTDGASLIAVKIDDGAYSRLDESLYSDRSVWAVIQPDPATGDFDTTITMPDGTTATSTPALPSGAHKLRFLTGTMKPGDRVRSRLSGEVVIGDYSPNGAPEPLDPAALSKGAKGGVKAKIVKKKLEVTVPGARAGDWIYLDAYVDGAPRAPWGPTWFQASAKGVVSAPLKGVTLPEGVSKLTVQSGNQGEVGRLRGWARLKIAGADETTSGSKTTSASASTSGSSAASSTAGSTATATAASAPVTAPSAPVEDIGQLTSDNAGEVTGTLEGGQLRVSVPGGTVDQWLHVWLYDAQGHAALGWTRLDADRTFVVDVSALGDARFKLAVQDEQGQLLGWTGGGVDAPVDERAAGVVTAAPAAAGIPVDDTPAPLLLNLGLSGIGLVSLVGTMTALALGRRPAPGKD